LFPQPVDNNRIWSLAKFCWTAVVVMAVFGLFSLGAVPDVNEAHYWTKAKRFWNPAFCPRDLFLNSADAHWSFYVTLGQLTRCLPLELATWVGRGVVWLAIASGWTALGSTWRWPWWQVAYGAALFVVLTRWFHLSGEWVIGGAEAKGLAFAALFWAVALAQQGRWPAAFLLGGVSAGFHVLVGGWLVVCLGITLAYHCWTSSDQRRWVGQNLVSLMGAMVGGGLCSLPGLVPALALMGDGSPELTRQATEIYVLQRLPHHLALWAFSPHQLLYFSSLLVVWLGLMGCDGDHRSSEELRRADRVMTSLVHAALGLAAVGVGLSVAVLQGGSEWSLGVGLLRYYWFRTADVLLPLGVVFASLSWRWANVDHPAKTQHATSRRSVWMWAGIFALPTTAIVWEGKICQHKIVIDGRPNADQASLPADVDPRRTAAIFGHWRNACGWVRDHTEPAALFLTPRGQQTFKWYAQRSEVVSWKDVPQDSRGLLEWRQRVNDCAAFWQSDYGLAIQDPVRLHELIEKYQVDYVLMPQYAYELQHRFGRALPYRRVYPARAEQRTYYVILSTQQWQPSAKSPTN
jgi:hypothetical protein